MNKIISRKAHSNKPAQKSGIREAVVRQAGEISTHELTKLAKASAAHEWLHDPAEDIYNMNDGEARIVARETYKRGSVALVRFPYTDLSDSKVRPAVILTPDRYLAENDDVLCAFISSVLPDPLLMTDVILSSTHPDFTMTGLKRSSVLRTHKIVLLDRNLVFSKLGDLSPALIGQMDTALLDALGLKT